MKTIDRITIQFAYHRSPDITTCVISTVIKGMTYTGVGVAVRHPKDEYNVRAAVKHSLRSAIKDFRMTCFYQADAGLPKRIYKMIDGEVRVFYETQVTNSPLKWITFELSTSDAAVVDDKDYYFERHPQETT